MVVHTTLIKLCPMILRYSFFLLPQSEKFAATYNSDGSATRDSFKSLYHTVVITN